MLTKLPFLSLGYCQTIRPADQNELAYAAHVCKSLALTHPVFDASCTVTGFPKTILLAGIPYEMIYLTAVPFHSPLLALTNNKS